MELAEAIERSTSGVRGPTANHYRFHCTVQRLAPMPVKLRHHFLDPGNKLNTTKTQ